MADTDVKIRLQLKDDGTQSGINRAARQVEQMQQRTVSATTRSAGKQRTETQKLATARTMLATRSEQRIRREIMATEAAYNRLARSGQLSMQELSRAAEASRTRITRLTNEMGKLTAEQTRQAKLARGAKWGQYAVIGGAGIMAAGMALKDPAQRAMSYDRMLADLANTTYNDRDVAGRIAGMKDLEETVNKARREGGGTRESVTEALNTVIAAGVIDTETSKLILGDIIKAATASGADANDLALVAVRAIDNFGIDPKRMQGIFSGTIRGGQLGGFETKDMGKWLGQQMATASLIGMKGEEDMARLIAYNQLAVKTAGSADQAGTNVKDMLNAFSSSHFKQHAAQLFLNDGKPLTGRGDRYRLQQQWDNLLLDYQGKGVGPTQAIIELLDKRLSKDPRLQKLREELKNIDPADESARRHNLEAQTGLIRGSAIGKLFGNQQELAGFISIYNNLDELQKLESAIKKQFASGSELGNSFTVHANTPGYKVSQAREDALVAEKAVMDELTPLIGRTAEVFSDLARKHPMLAGGITIAAKAVGSLGVGATLATVALMRLSSRIPAVAVPGGRPGVASPGAAGGRGRMAKAGRGLATAAASATVAGIGNEALQSVFGEDSRITSYGTKALNGAAIGATVGSVVPVLGTAAGAVAGGAIGLVYEAVREAFAGVEPQKVRVEVETTVRTPDGAKVEAQTVKTSGDAAVTARTGNLVTGAP